MTPKELSNLLSIPWLTNKTGNKLLETVLTFWVVNQFTARDRQTLAIGAQFSQPFFADIFIMREPHDCVAYRVPSAARGVATQDVWSPSSILWYWVGSYPDTLSNLLVELPPRAPTTPFDAPWICGLPAEERAVRRRVSLLPNAPHGSKPKQLVRS